MLSGPKDDVSVPDAVRRGAGEGHFAGLERKRRSSWGMKTIVGVPKSGLRAARA